MTISIQTLATILIIAHIGSAIFMTMVLRRQYKLFAIPVTEHDENYEVEDIKRIKRFRLTLFTLSCIVLAGNIIPIVIDGITIFTDNSLHRTAHIQTISLLYAISNALTALISAYLISTLYRIAKGVNDPNLLVEKDLNRNK